MRDRTEWIPTLRFIITTVADDKPKWNCGGLSIHRCWNRCSYWSHPGLKMAKSFGNVTTVDSQINRNWLPAGALIKTNQINQREITFKQRQRLRLSEIGAEIAARTCMKRPILHRFFFFLPQTLNEEASTLKWWFKGVWVSILSCQKKKRSHFTGWKLGDQATGSITSSLDCYLHPALFFSEAKAWWKEKTSTYCTGSFFPCTPLGIRRSSWQPDRCKCPCSCTGPFHTR